ncbi:MFS transporter [Actinocatenispora sera]|uniref:MFS transporter n=1 Tax=Actinocatenispora sera TaxID=390989 RepID=UPI00340C2EF7
MRGRYGLARYLAGATAARTGDEASGPALVLLGLAATGSTRSAGLVLGALTAATAVGGPLLGAVLDRAHRPPRFLAGCLLGYAAGLALLTVVLARAALWPAVLVAVAAGAFGPALSAGWSSRLATVVSPAAIRRGYAADSASFAVSALVGPALAGVLAATLHPTHAVLAAAMLLLAAAPFALALPPRRPNPANPTAASPPPAPTPASRSVSRSAISRSVEPTAASRSAEPTTGYPPPEPTGASLSAPSGIAAPSAEPSTPLLPGEPNSDTGAAEPCPTAATAQPSTTYPPAASDAASVPAGPNSVAAAVGPRRRSAMAGSGTASAPAEASSVAAANASNAASVPAEPIQPPASSASLATMLRRGARAVLADRMLRSATLVSALSYLGIGSATVALPVLGATLTGRPGAGALLLSVTAGGALLATAALARWPVPIGAPAQVAAATGVMGAGLAVLACAPSWPVALAGAALVGLGDGPQLSALLELRHRAAPPDLRTQVFAAGVSIKQAGYAVGAALSGLLAASSARPALVLAGLAQVAALAVAAVAAHRRASIS